MGRCEVFRTRKRSTGTNSKYGIKTSTAGNKGVATTIPEGILNQQNLDHTQQSSDTISLGGIFQATFSSCGCEIAMGVIGQTSAHCVISAWHSQRHLFPIFVIGIALAMVPAAGG
jgi:hypothetical protein